MAKQYALVFDTRRCIGCLTCVIACKVENNLDDGYSWMKVLTNRSGQYPNLKTYWQPTVCMQCQKPPCIDSCPVEAIYKRPDGIVIIDKDKCNGCQACLTACPYGVIEFNSKVQIAEKCTLCAHRVDLGLLPFCAKECVWGAVHFGDIEDPQSEVSQLVAKRGGYVIRSEEGTQPSAHYLP